MRLLPLRHPRVALRAYAVARRGRTAWPPLALVLSCCWPGTRPFAPPARGTDGGMSHAAERRANAPEPDSDAKPDSPKDLTKPSWVYVLRKTAREFSDDQCTDLAAALTYYAVLALFPAMIALLSLVGLVASDPQKTSTTLTDILKQSARAPPSTSLEPVLKRWPPSPGGRTRAS